MRVMNMLMCDTAAAEVTRHGFSRSTTSSALSCLSASPTACRASPTVFSASCSPPLSVTSTCPARPARGSQVAMRSVRYRSSSLSVYSALGLQRSQSGQTCIMINVKTAVYTNVNGEILCYTSKTAKVKQDDILPSIAKCQCVVE